LKMNPKLRVRGKKWTFRSIFKNNFSRSLFVKIVFAKSHFEKLIAADPGLSISPLVLLHSPGSQSLSEQFGSHEM
jgi:hypothetical protein